MIAACPSTIATGALARDVIASADCLIGSEVQQGYATLLAPGGSFATALTLALTIYVATFAYRLILGLTSLTLAEVVPHFVKIGIVFALVTSWASYQTLIFDTLFHAPEQFADAIVRQAAGAGTTGGDVLGALQEVMTRMIDAAGDAWGQVPAVPHPVMTAAAATNSAAPGAGTAVPAAPAATMPALGAPQLVAGLLWVGVATLMAASVGVLLVARIVLALLLLLGPVFLAFALFASTRGLAEGWLRVTVKFALVPLFALPLIAAVVAVLGPVVAGFDAAPIVSARDGPALLIALIVLVFAAVMAQAARLGGGIAGSIRLPRPTPAKDRANAAGTAAVIVSDRADIGSRRVQTIVAGGERRAAAATSTGTLATMATMATSRAIVTAAPASPFVASASRLGQSYRRLAVTPPIRSER